MSAFFRNAAGAGGRLPAAQGRLQFSDKFDSEPCYSGVSGGPNASSGSASGGSTELATGGC